MLGKHFKAYIDIFFKQLWLNLVAKVRSFSKLVTDVEIDLNEPLKTVIICKATVKSEIKLK